MPGYSSEEVQASVNKFLLGTITTARTSLGSRDVLSAWDDIYALLTTSLLLRPDSYFYVVWLAKNRLEALRRKQVEDLTYIVSASTTAALVRRGKPVTSTADLVNAQAALLNLNAGLNAGQGLQTRELGPEVARFRGSIESFIAGQLRDNVVEAGVPTETAGETRAVIATRWAAVKARHDEMLVLSEAIQDAVTNLSSMRLPEKAVKEIITRLRTRIEELTAALEADKSLETHRESMLDLLTMRALLTRVSAFRVPQQLLAPLTSDNPYVTGGGGLTAASLLGTISGGFNVDPGDTLDFESGSPVVVSSIALTRYSNAEIVSGTLTFPLTMPALTDLCLRVDGTLYASDPSFGGAVYADMTAFVAAIQAYLTTTTAPATVFAVGATTVIRSASSADVSSIELVSATNAQKNFLFTAGFQPYGVCTPVSAQDIISDATAFPAVLLSEQASTYFTASGLTAAAGVLDLSKASGTMVVGGSQMTAPTNLEHQGVKAGDYFFAGTEASRIASVRGAVFTLDDDFSALGLSSFRIGADYRDVPAGARVMLGSVTVPLNSGPYRVVSGSVGRVTLDRAFFATADSVSAHCFESFLVAAAPDATPADGITAWPASGGAAAVGFTPSATQSKAEMTELYSEGVVDYLARGVVAGDRVTVLASTTETATVTGVEPTTLYVDGVPYFAGTAAYRVESSKYLAWVDLVAAVTAFVDAVDFPAADFAITRILSGAAPAPLLSNLSSMLTALDTLADIQAYSVPFERGIDNILKMLVERGMDRAADLLTTLQVVELFSMHPDGVSYSTHLIRTAHTVTMEVAPVSRAAKSIIGSPEVRLRSRRLGAG